MRSVVKITLPLLFILLFVLIDIHISYAQVDPSISACYPHHPPGASCTAHTCSSQNCFVIMVSGIDGLGRFIYTGGVSSGESFYFCNVDVRILCGGQFCGIAMGGGHFTPEMAQFLSRIPPCGACDLVVSASPSEVWPKSAGNNDKTTSTIMVTATNPPPEGCTVDFKVEPVENSGGHSHSGSRLKGTVTPATLTIPGGSSGAASAEYKSSEVAGEEKIIAEIKGEKKGETTVSVKVASLEPLAAVSFGYNLTGSTSSHPSNHYGTSSTNLAIYNIAYDYLGETGKILGINDMSLPWGGLFDIGPPYGSFWSSPHGLHRAGKSVDVDRSNVDQPLLNRIASRYGGSRAKEGKRCSDCIHYEFP